MTRIWAANVCQVRAAAPRRLFPPACASSGLSVSGRCLRSLLRATARRRPKYLLLLVMQLFCPLLHVVLLLPMMVAPERAYQWTQYQIGDLVASPLAVAPTRPQVITPFRGSPSVALLAPLSSALR